MTHTARRAPPVIWQTPLAAICLIGMIMPPVASAQTAVAPEAVKPVDVAAAPLDELNLRKVKLSPVLEAARAHPYTIPGGGRCAALNHDVAELNEALGPDIDEAPVATDGDKRNRAVGGTARSVVGSLIPFSGVVRQISGAAAEERRRELYLYAGSVRRAFLKGYAKARGCRIARTVATKPAGK